MPPIPLPQHHLHFHGPPRSRRVPVDGRDPRRYPLRSLELCICPTSPLTESYVHGIGGNSAEGSSNTPWQRVCDLLVGLPNLQSLYIWFDSRKPRPWHKTFGEARCFAKLFDVRVADRSRSILNLPELPANRIKPAYRKFEQYWLEGEKIDRAPFTVIREWIWRVP